MEIPISEHIIERVVKGAAYLDTIRPGWEDEIDLEILDITDASCCVLGELYADEVPADDEHLNGYDYATKKFSWSIGDAAAHGFTVASWGEPKQWEELQAAWEELITARLAAKAEDSDG